MRIYFLLLCLAFAGISSPMAQTAKSIKITGVVTDIESGETLPSVHVYFSQTTQGTVTDSEGRYVLETNLEGSLKLVFSYIGYETHIEELNFEKQASNQSIDVELNPKPFELGGVEVVASNREWKQNFRTFESELLGHTSFASQTKILNPHVVEFDDDQSDWLSARVNQPLLVSNEALGYNLRVEVQEFEWKTNGDEGHYIIHPHFLEIDTDNRSQKKKWEKNRERAYTHSFSHFLQALYAGELRQNQYEVVAGGSSHRVELKPLPESELRSWFLKKQGYIPRQSDLNVKAFRLTVDVDVYIGRSKRYVTDTRPQTKLVPGRSDGIFIVTENGSLYDARQLSLDGFWGSQRLADLLPENYSLQTP